MKLRQSGSVIPIQRWGLFALAAFAWITLEAPAEARSVVPARDFDPDPHVFSTRLVAKPARIDLNGDGLRERVWTFNGLLPGPEIRAKAGDIIDVRFKNRLPVPTTVHWHGVQVTNGSDGTPVTQNEVPPGGTYRYRFEVPDTGTFWYHPHVRPSNQVYKGLYGSLVVTDSSERKLARLGVIPRREETFILSDVTACKEPGANDDATFPADPSLPWAGGDAFPGNTTAPTPRDLCEQPMDERGNRGGAPLPAGTVPFVQPGRRCLMGDGPPCRVNAGQWVLVNGRVPGARAGSPEEPGALAATAQPLEIASGDAVRLRLINASLIRFFRLRLTTADGKTVPIYRIGGEAGLLNRTRLEGGVDQKWDTEYDRGEILLGPSDRADVVVIAQGEGGDVMTLWTLDYPHTGRGYFRVPTVPITHFEIGSASGAGEFRLAERTRLLSDPRIDQPTVGLKGLEPTGGFLNPSKLPGTPAGSADRTIRLTNAVGPSIDNVIGTFDAGGVPNFADVPFLDSTRYARVGDLLRLEVRNDTMAHHVFHLHGFFFQPLKMKNAGRTVFRYRQPEFVDSIDIPPGFTLVFKLLLEDRPLQPGLPALGGAVGRWLYHCHLFPHSALGMISELVVLPRE